MLRCVNNCLLKTCSLRVISAFVADFTSHVLSICNIKVGLSETTLFSLQSLTENNSISTTENKKVWILCSRNYMKTEVINK
jgi:hypothetical protein